MKEKIKYLLGKKSFHLGVIISTIAILIFILFIIILRYNVEGEKNMPFVLSKISTISSSEGINKENTNYKWSFNICQNNDIYLYIDKNQEYNGTEMIKSVVIENIQLEGKNKENLKTYKPDGKEEKLIFKNSEENSIQRLEFLGDLNSQLKSLKISNQGGIIAFRCANENIAEYNTNDEVINHNELLKKANIENEELKVNIKFDLIIKLEDNKEYMSNIQLELPIGNVVENGTTSTDKTDVNEFIFKRIKN